MDATTTVKAYKSLSQVEEAFRCYKSIDLKVRPIYHYKGDRVKAQECTIKEGSYRFSKITRPTYLQQKALDLLGVSLICTQ